jgi:DNA polymerase III alpha subunit
MIHLRLRTEYSLGAAYGRVEQVLAAAGGSAAGMTDNGTWGHVNFAKAAEKLGIKPLFGVEVAVVPDLTKRERQPTALMALLARSTAGLSEMYQLMSRANENFYYAARLDYVAINNVSSELIVLSGVNADLDRLKMRPNVYLEYSPSAPLWNKRIAKLKGYSKVVCCDNVYPSVEDRQPYEILAFRNRKDRTTAMHITDEDELRMLIPEATDEDFMNNERIAAECDAKLPKAQMVRFPNPRPLLEAAHAGWSGARLLVLARSSVTCSASRTWTRCCTT